MKLFPPLGFSSLTHLAPFLLLRAVPGKRVVELVSISPGVRTVRRV
jgi:hypothetical protein